MSARVSEQDLQFMRLALRLARRGYGATSPNPMVGAILTKRGRAIGRGWHRRAGAPHAEIEAILDARQHGHNPKGAALFVTLEPCCTYGRTPPCTDAIISAGIKRVVVGATDPNPRHCGKAFSILQRAGIAVTHGVLAQECSRLNQAFNHWVVHRTPFVTVKAAMTLDGKIATAAGESKWITGEKARAYGRAMRRGADAVLVGINTILADDPSLTSRDQQSEVRRIVLDAGARTPLQAKVVNDEHSGLTTIVVSASAPKQRVAALARRVKVLVAPTLRVGRAVEAAPPSLQGSRSEVRGSQVPRSTFGSRPSLLDLRWLLKKLGADDITSLLVEGGGEVNASFLMQRLAQRIAFFYAPKILGGRDSRRAVAGQGATDLAETLDLSDIEWRSLGPDLLLTARVAE